MIERSPTPDEGAASPPLLVNYSEAARLLCVSRRTVEALAAAGVLRRVSIGAPGSRKPAVRFVYKDLVAWIERVATGGQ